MIRARARLHSAMLAFALVSWALGGAPASAAASAPSDAFAADARVEDRFHVETAPALDSLAAEIAGGREALRRLWTRSELYVLAERLRERLAAGGALAAVVRLSLAPGPGSSIGNARLSLAPGGALAPARLEVRFLGAEEVVPGPEGLFDGPPGSPIERIAAGLSALRAAARERGRYGAEARVDSIVPHGDRVVAHVRLLAGPPVRVESFELAGAAATRPSAAAAIAGMKPGRLVTPRALEEARDRLYGSDLFTSVGEVSVEPGRDPSLARLRVPVEESRSSRFEGAVGLASPGGLTGLLDLALGNLGGTGRSAGGRWSGVGDGRSDYAFRYREPALLGRALDATVALDARVYDSLYTQTRWSLTLGTRPAPRWSAAIGLERSGAVYTGAARGGSSSLAAQGTAAFLGLLPRENPTRGFSVSASAQAGRRSEEAPGLPRLSRGLVRASLGLEAARATGARRALYGALRAERVALGGGDFPAEELRYAGGGEGLRGHPDRAFGGNALLLATAEHRWLSGAAGGRSYLFVDAARHALDAPLQAGAQGPRSGAGPLARTVLSGGWEFGYGAGLRTRAAAGTVGVEIGFRPGAAVREAQLHVRYASTW